METESGDGNTTQMPDALVFSEWDFLGYGYCLGGVFSAILIFSIVSIFLIALLYLFCSSLSLFHRFLCSESRLLSSRGSASEFIASQARISEQQDAEEFEYFSCLL